MAEEKQTSPEATSVAATGAPARRSFFTIGLAILVGAVAGLAPLASGLIVLLDPLRRKRKPSMVELAPLDAVPDDGLPHLFPVIDTREDAWNKYPARPVGAVYLIRQPGEKVPTAFTATCPHLGCFIGYARGDSQFECPCHTSKFALDGDRIGGDQSVAPRGMDSLKVTVRPAPNADDGLPKVYVEYERFQTGIHEKKPIA